MSDARVKVFSIFSSIQGESTRAGRPCSFVRLAGCPLGCSYCDTREASESEGVEMQIDEIVERLRALGLSLVEVTGGEPLAQERCPELLERLVEEGFEVLLETSGAFPIRGLDPAVSLVMDIKTPGSGMSDRLVEENLEHLVPGRDEVKLVVTSRGDFEWALGLCSERSLSDRAEVLLSPAAGRVRPAELAEWLLESRRELRMQIQLHRAIWPEDGEGR
ncbi:MAG: radical SAM protein [Polyangia bacterium]